MSTQPLIELNQGPFFCRRLCLGWIWSHVSPLHWFHTGFINMRTWTSPYLKYYMPWFTGWPHFWKAKFPEFSPRFSGYLKIFPWATQETKIRWNAFLLAIMSYIFHFSWVFQVFSTKIQISLSSPWDSDNFSNAPSFPGFPCFPGLWPPWV